MKVFVKQRIVAEMRIGLESLGSAKDRPAALSVAQEDSRKPPGKLGCDVSQVHPLPRSGGKFHREIIPEIMLKTLQGFDEQIVDGKPYRSAPVRIASK